jgi:hypothetical protein
MSEEDKIIEVSQDMAIKNARAFLSAPLVRSHSSLCKDKLDLGQLLPPLTVE